MLEHLGEDGGEGLEPSGVVPGEVLDDGSGDSGGTRRQGGGGPLLPDGRDVGSAVRQYHLHDCDEDDGDDDVVVVYDGDYDYKVAGEVDYDDEDN